MKSPNIISEGDTVEPIEEKQKEEKTKEEKPKKEKTKDKKESSKSSKSKSQKGEEKDIYFIISYTLDKKEDPKEITFSKECDATPQTLLTKEIETSNKKYAYKKVFKYRNIGGKKNVELVYFYGEELDKYIITLEIKDKTFIYDVDLKIGHRYLTKIVPIVIKQDIKYQDNIAPTITLDGGEKSYVYLNHDYNEQGYSSNDNCDGDITSNVKVNNYVDTSKPGNYKIEYSVSDSTGNKNTVKFKSCIKRQLSFIQRRVASVS